MMFITHLSFSFLLGLLIIRYADVSLNPFVFMFILLMATLIPDIDYPGSFLGKKLKLSFLSFKHRGFFHSITPGVILSIILFLFIQNSYYALAVLLGFASHLLLDSLTKTGIAPFWPSKLRVKGKLKTTGFVDWILLLGFLMLIILLFI